MFGFLKKKLHDAVSKFSKDAEAEVKEETVKDEAAIRDALEEERRLKERVQEKVRELPKRSFFGIFGKKEERPGPVHHGIEQPIKAPVPSEVTTTKPLITVNEVETPALKQRKGPVKAERVTPVKEELKEEPTEELRTEVAKGEWSGKERLKEQGKEKELKRERVLETVAPEEAPEESTEKLLEKGPEKAEMPLVTAPLVKDTEQRLAQMSEPVVVSKENAPEPAPEPLPVKLSFFSRLKETFTKKTLSPEKFDQLFWELEVTLLENNVAVEVIEKLKTDLKSELTGGKVSRLGLEELVLISLRQSIEEVLEIEGFDLVGRIKESRKSPFVIAFIGVNGSGKTTTLAKIANLFQQEGLSVVMAASDTFRAAAIDQLKEHADKLGIKLISQGYGADPAAVAFDAVEHAKAKKIDVVMIDTAGRLHSNTNLMAELQKVVRVTKPDLKIFIGESITGNDCVEQAKEFDRLVGIDAIVLSKADVDEKGGAALSVSYVTKKPILYLGVGQAYGDLKPFDKELVVKNLGL